MSISVIIIRQGLSWAVEPRKEEEEEYWYIRRNRLLPLSLMPKLVHQTSPELTWLKQTQHDITSNKLP
jgi:hypothetical protein